MSANLSTIEHFGTGFDRSVFLGLPSTINTAGEWSEVRFKNRISEVPQSQLPPRLRRTNSKIEESSPKGLGFREPLEVLGEWIQAKQFDGLLLIPDALFVFPQQRFVAFSKGQTDVLESRPTDAWPQIRIELTRSSNATLTVQKFLLRPSGDTVESEILYTRALYTLSKIGSCFLASEFTDKDQVGVTFGFQPFPEEHLGNILNRAKIARKLKFIENIFKLRLTLPENITPDHVQYIETIFRGLTEGEFVSRANGTTVFLRAAEVVMSELPVSTPGAFKYCLGTEQALLFPQRVLDVGPYYLILRRAIVANSELLTHLRNGHDSWVRFEILDGQITYRYEKYLRPERHKLVQQKLDRFYSALVLAESHELATTLLEPLISDVRSDAATLIAVGWLQYHSFADRFSPQEPVLEKDNGLWRVPIHITYTTAKSVPVGEILIDIKTGGIVEEPSPELIRKRGLTQAEKMLRVG